MPAFTKTLLTLLSVSLLFGCSAFDDDDDDNSVAKTSLSGKVADGYLAGAKVCLDLNSNKVCDDGEPSTTSTDGGEFSLEGVTQAQLDSAPLLVEIIVGETIDEDNPNTTIDKKYTLTAPAGYAFISPLTTMVQSEIEDSGLSPEEAAGSVQAKLGTTLDLEADYVSGSESGDDAAEFARLHKVAQVTVVVLQNNIELVENVLAGAEVSFEDLVGLIVAQVLDALETISTQVNAAGENFDPATVADSDAIDAANVDAATIADDIAEREAARLIATANIAAVLGNNDSLHFFDADERQSGLEFSYGSVSKGDNNSVSITKTKYDSNTDTWVAEAADEDTEQICVLTSSTWTCVNEDSETIAIEGDAVIVKVGGLDASRSEITGVSVDLTNKRIQSFFDDEEFVKVTDPTTNFSTGATGYKLSFKRTQDMYAIFKDNVANGAACEHDDNATDGWCNNVRIRNSDGNFGSAATTLAELITATAAANPTEPSDIRGISIYGNGLEILVEFVAGGIANYYVMSHQENQASSIEDKTVGSWLEKVVDGKTILSFTPPPALAVRANFESDELSQFFSVEDGYVRRGGIDPAGERGNQEWVFNNLGRDQILAAFDYDLLTDLTPCSSEDVDFDPDNLGEEPGATAAEFVTAASNCSAVDFSATELVDTTLVTDFGFLNFKAAGAGVFLGEVGDLEDVVLDFTWAVDGNGHIVVNTQSTVLTVTIHLRLTLAKVEGNARQISLVTFGQEATTSAGLDTIKGNIFGEVWGLN